MNKTLISKDAAFYMLQDMFKKELENKENRSFSCADNYSFHINPYTLPRDKVTTMLYEFSKRYSIIDGLFLVVPNTETIFKIV